jgi:hypothetical protein
VPLLNLSGPKRRRFRCLGFGYVFAVGFDDFLFLRVHWKIVWFENRSVSGARCGHGASPLFENIIADLAL